MSVLTHVNSVASGVYVNAGEFHNKTIPAVGSGNSLVAIIQLASGEAFTTSPTAWNGTTDVALNLLTSEAAGSDTWHLYQLGNITHAATSIRFKINASNIVNTDIFEIGGTGGVPPTLKVNQKTSLLGDTSFSVGYTTTTPNEFVIAHLAVGSGGTQVPSAPFSIVTHANYGFDSFYNANAGSAGSKTVAWTSGYAAPLVWLISFGNSVPSPTVTSVTSSGVTEGGNMVFTVTLSGATNGSTNYAFTPGDTATAGTDYTSPLTSGMCNNGVTVSGSDFVVPDATSSWTVTIPTTQDALDEDTETIVLTVGGVASTGGTITDDDAPPTISITSSVTVDGGDSVVITCTLGAVSGRVTQARLVLTDGTKVGGVDYTNVITNGMLSNGVTISAGVLSIPAGVGSFTITIPTTP